MRVSGMPGMAPHFSQRPLMFLVVIFLSAFFLFLSFVCVCKNRCLVYGFIAPLLQEL
jgi:hypothetical protein